jgi:pimeloyl-ACP methyl ester carboxylesterase
MNTSQFRFSCNFVAVVIAIAGFLPAVHAAGTYYKLDYAASSDTNELQTPVTYTIWIPDDAPRLRAIIVHQHGAGTTASIEGSTAAYDLHWQALAKKWHCALFSSSYHVINEKTDMTPCGSEPWFDPRHGSERTFLRALDDFAVKSNHPEMSKVPWVLWGHSGGGIWANVMACLHPDRVVAMWLRSGTAAMFRGRPEFAQPEVPAAVYGIPTMCNSGVKEERRPTFFGAMATFLEYRLNGAPIGFAPDPKTDHECGDSRYLAIPFLDACLAARLPGPDDATQALKPMDRSHEWLAPLMSANPLPAADYKGNPNLAVWLPNETIAKDWAEYVKTGAVSDKTPPPPPFKVSTANGANGTEITWDAEADFESGIRNFVILRDGQELASVPETPIGKFGRPLFQSMTYHDTPSQPLPKMQYLDASAKPGENHTYAVITVNSVGLKSEPSSSTANSPSH